MDISGMSMPDMQAMLFPTYVERSLEFAGLDIDEVTREQLRVRGREKFEDFIRRLDDARGASWETMPETAKETWVWEAAVELGLMKPWLTDDVTGPGKQG
ncbi:MAG: hypothetical protein WAV90_19235 [Gordonia amarae]